MPSLALLQRLADECDLFIATDGAANTLADTPLRPGVVLGDFDSLEPGVRDQMPGTRFVETPDQEKSDLEKAILYAIERDAETITLAGCLGSRLDHSLTALSLLIAYRGRSAMRLVTDTSEAIVGSHWTQVNGAAGDTLSLIVFAPADGVSVDGVRWPLRDERLVPGSRGVSNEMTGTLACISVRQGTVIVVHERRAAEPA